MSQPWDYRLPPNPAITEADLLREENASLQHRIWHLEMERDKLRKESLPMLMLSAIMTEVK